MLSLVAGHVEENEAPRTAMAREVTEELGIQLGQCDLVKRYSAIAGDVCRYGANCHEWYVYISDQVVRESEVRLAADELHEVLWVKIEELAKVGTLTFATTSILPDLQLI